VVDSSLKELLEGNPLIHTLHIFNTRQWRKQPFSAQTRREVATLWSELRHNSYDVVFDIQGNLKSGLIGWASGVKKRIGFPVERLQEKINSWLTTEKSPFSNEDTHAVLRCLSAVNVPFNLPYREMELVSDIATSSDDDTFIEELLAKIHGKKILFHCGTTWQTKFWYRDGWLALGKKLTAFYPDATILFSSGSIEEKSVAWQIASHIGGSTVVLDRFPLKRFASLLKHVDLVIGADTGPIHLAAAVGTPTVSFYRSSDGSESGPRGCRHIIVQSPLSCTRCFRTSCPMDAECRESITVDDLLIASCKLLG
jgi:heptosyltransferase-1